MHATLPLPQAHYCGLLKSTNYCCDERPKIVPAAKSVCLMRSEAHLCERVSAAVAVPISTSEHRARSAATAKTDTSSSISPWQCEQVEKKLA